MSRIELALGSLIIGASLGFFWGNHTSIALRVSAAQVPPPNSPGFINVDAAPKIPPITMHFDKATVANKTQTLDGAEFKDSEFRNVTWEYSGGAFVLINDKIETPMRVNFHGAAANTLALLALIDALNRGARPAPMDPNAPVIRQTTTARRTVMVDFSSPYSKMSH